MCTNVCRRKSHLLAFWHGKRISSFNFWHFKNRAQTRHAGDHSAINKLIASECLCNLCYFSRGGIGLKTNSNLEFLVAPTQNGGLAIAKGSRCSSGDCQSLHSTSFRANGDWVGNIVGGRTYSWIGTVPLALKE